MHLDDSENESFNIDLFLNERSDQIGFGQPSEVNTYNYEICKFNADI